MFLFAPVYLGSSYMSISINKKAQSMGVILKTHQIQMNSCCKLGSKKGKCKVSLLLRLCLLGSTDSLSNVVCLISTILDLELA